MRPLSCGLWIVALTSVWAGCNKNPFLAAQQQQAWQQQQQLLAQTQEFQRRASELDANNRDLHSQLAQSQQQAKVLSDELAMVRERLSDTTNQLAQSRLAQQDADRRVNAIEASTRYRGGATITANNGLKESLKAIDIPGVTVREEAGEVHIELPADRLFLRGTPTLHQQAYPLLDQVAAAMTRAYPRQSIRVEGHTDSDAAYGTQWHNNHQLSVIQASAVFDQLTSRYQIPAQRLSLVGHGSTQPLVSNGTEEGKARNRRVELVISP